MKKSILTLLIVSAAITMTVAQKKERKYEKIYYKDLTVERDDLSITINNAVSTENGTKFKIKITNKTNEYLIYKPKESRFIINGKEMKIAEKWLLIKPNESDFKTINLKGLGYNAVKNYSFIVDGVYKVIPNENSSISPDFRLSSEQNTFNANNFNCTVENIIQEKNVIEVKLKCSYNGDKIGFISPSKASIKTLNGDEHANVKSKEKPIILFKGESDTVTLKWERKEGEKVMNVRKGGTMIKWGSTFNEAQLQKTKGEVLELTLDEKKSN